MPIIAEVKKLTIIKDGTKYHFNNDNQRKAIAELSSEIQISFTGESDMIINLGTGEDPAIEIKGGDNLIITGMNIGKLTVN